MNGFVKFGLVFLGGLVLGAVAKQAASCNGLRPAAADLLSKGLDLKDSLMAKVETLKENVEDIVAEAQNASEKRKFESEQANPVEKV